MSPKESPRLISRNLNASRVVMLARRPGGVTTAEITGLPTSTVGRLMLDLCAEKMIFQAKDNYRFCRYFGTPTEAEHWLATHTKQAKEPSARPLPQPPSHGTCGARWAPDAKVTWPTHADGTPAYKLTVAPRLPTGVFRTSTFSTTG